MLNSMCDGVSAPCCVILKPTMQTKILRINSQYFKNYSAIGREQNRDIKRDRSATLREIKLRYFKEKTAIEIGNEFGNIERGKKSPNNNFRPEKNSMFQERNYFMICPE